MKLKKLVALALCGAMTLSFTACGDVAKKKDDSADGGKKTYKIGVLQFGEFSALQNAYAGFQEEMKAQGIEVEYEYQSAAADTANCPTIADTLVSGNPDLILGIATPSVSALKEKTVDIPVVFTAVTDPADSKLVASNETPGGNVTGTSDLTPVKEQINLIPQIVPEAKTVEEALDYIESYDPTDIDISKVKIR